MFEEGIETMENGLYLSIVVGLIGLVFALVKARAVMAEDDGNDTMRGIAKAIQEGAASFLKREYTFLTVFVVGMFVVLVLFIDLDILDKFGERDDSLFTFATSVSYLIGAILSGTAGYLGMTLSLIHI